MKKYINMRIIKTKLRVVKQVYLNLNLKQEKMHYIKILKLTIWNSNKITTIYYKTKVNKN
jgi:hypothetical protein